MSDWESRLNETERERWRSFVTHMQESTVSAMASSAYVASLCPDDGEFDVKFALETGLAVLLDKPIIAIALAGRTVPPGLARVAHAVLEVDDIDTAAGQTELGQKLQATIAWLEASGEAAVTTQDLSLAEECARISARLTAAFDGSALSSTNRQALALAEECGEFVGAYRRWSGQARRNGATAAGRREMEMELADVVITAYITAAALGFDLDARVAEKLALVRERPAKEWA